MKQQKAFEKAEQLRLKEEFQREKTRIEKTKQEQTPKSKESCQTKNENF